MASVPKIFISYQQRDKAYVHALAGLQTRKNRKRLSWMHNRERKDVRAEGKQAVRTYLKELIEPVETVILLLGPNTKDSKWVRHEMKAAKKLGKTTFVIQIPLAKGTPPLPRHVDPEIKVHSWRKGIAALRKRFR